MIVTGPEESEVTVSMRREYEQDEPDSCFYVEKISNLIYEVKLFEDYALIRPAHPEFSMNLERMDLLQFSKEFEEFTGDSQKIHEFLWGRGTIDFIIENT